MEDLKPVPAREMLHQAHIELQQVMLLIDPNETLLERDYLKIAKASFAIKLLWEANRGY